MKESELVAKIAKGKIAFHEASDFADAKTAIAARRAAVEKMSGASLKHVGACTIGLGAITNRNIDSPIGAVQVPVGVAGPLRVNGAHAKGAYPIFLATTEGALVASVNRGCSALNAAGGANARVFKDAMTRAPAFRAKDAGAALAFVSWVEKNFGKIKAEAERTTSHGRLLSITPFIAGRTAFLRFAYSTGDASGLNMVTVATDAAVKFIGASQRFAKCVALSGNMCVDKKACALNALLGRGKSVIADALLPRKVVAQVLKTTPERIVDVNYRKNLIGSALAGSHSFNAHYANVIAAAFIALGQDAAHVVDGSLGMTCAEMDGRDLYVSVTLPALYVGTVGGGTRVETQAELLAAMRVKTSSELAEVIASAVLAGETSLLAALAAGELADAHAKLGR